MQARSSHSSTSHRSASFVGDVPIMPHSQYLSRDEYIDSRNIQDEQINVVLREMRGDIAEVKKDLKGARVDIRKLEAKTDVMQRDIEVLKTDVRELKIDVQELKAKTDVMQSDIEELKSDVRELKAGFNGLRADVGELQGESACSMAFLRNSNLHNPLLPIRPISMYRPSTGVTYPELFPKHAHETDALKKPTTPNQWKMLDYLATFYESSRHNTDEAVDCEVIIEFLEGILRLYEPNFEKFRQRAKEISSGYKYQPAKRLQEDQGNRQAQRPRTSYQPKMRLRDDGKFVDENGKVIGKESSSPVSKETIISWRNEELTTSGKERTERE